MLANGNCINRRLLRQTVATVKSSAGLCEEQGAADGSEYSCGCLTVLHEPLAELLHYRNLWLSYSITGTYGWVTPLQEPLAELIHYRTSGWVAPVQEPVAELLDYRNLWLRYSIVRTWLNHSITGTSGWVTPSQEPLADLLNYRYLLLRYSIAETSGWGTPLQKPLAELLHSCESFPKWHRQKTLVAFSQRWIGAWLLYKGKNVYRKETPVRVEYLPIIRYCLFLSTTSYLKYFSCAECLMRYTQNPILPSQVAVMRDRLIPDRRSTNVTLTQNVISKFVLLS